MAEGGKHLPVPPRGVRKHEIEEAPLFARRLAFEQGLGITGKFENPDALIHVGLLGVLMAVDLAQAARLLLAPLPGHPIEEVATDLAVELVNVHRLDSGLETVVLRAEPPDRLLVLAPLVGVTGMKGLANPLQHLIVAAQPS